MNLLRDLPLEQAFTTTFKVLAFARAAKTWQLGIMVSARLAVTRRVQAASSSPSERCQTAKSRVHTPLKPAYPSNSGEGLLTTAKATPNVTGSKMSNDSLAESDPTTGTEAKIIAEDVQPQYTSSISNFPNLPTHITDKDTISITISPIALITAECIAITSAMRKHSRWAQSSVSAILGGGGRRLQNGDSTRPLSDSRAGSHSTGPAIARSGSVTANGGGTSTLANRWGLRGQKGKSMQDNPLLSAFGQLRSDLASCKDIRMFDSPSLLHPFLQVIRSSSASAPITSLAINSITRFFSYNLINVNSPRISAAMQLLSAAMTNCRFEASDSAAEEIVLLRILKLMETMVCRPEGRLLGDGSVCELMSTCLEICCQARLSEVLRRAAEITLISMCQVIFSKLEGVNIEPLPTRSRSNTIAMTQVSEEMKMQPAVDGDAVASNNTATSNTEESAGGREGLERDVLGEANHLSTMPEHQPQDLDDEDDDVKPYSLPSIKEIFRALVDLLDPHNRKHTDTMRYMALRVIDVIFEVAGPSVADQPTLAKLANDDLCRCLLQLVKSENMLLLNGSLRVAGTLLATCRKVLKLQQEMFLSYLIGCLHSRVDIPTEPGIDPALYEGIPHAPKLVRPAPSQPSSGRSTPVPVKDRRTLGLEGGIRKPEAREAMVESIGNLVRIPSYMVELFVNYDCEVDREDLCEDMVALLSRNAFPDSATWSTTNVPPLCLDSLLTYIQFIADRLSPQQADKSEELLKLRERRSRKKIIVKGVARFNEEPKAGIAYLVTQGIIGSPDDHAQVARFLKGTTRVSKKVLGDFLSKKANEGLLKAFIGLFDFHHERLDEALRELLSTFRLPGESQLIERIVEVFTEKFCIENGSGDIADKDAAYTLTYATIMLNTDQHNPNIRPQNRMTSDAFARNLRGVNHGKDFAQEYLQEIYDSIKQEEIILPDEHDNKHAFEYAWKEMLMKTGVAGDLAIHETNAFDADMFTATWRPIVATLCYVFLSATDDAVQSRVVDGFHQCAQVAAHYEIPEAFDRIVVVLSSITTLASEKPPNTSLNTEVQVDHKSIIVSELAVRYGREYKPQLATVLLFRILNGHEDAIQDSWVHIVRILRNLFVNSLISFSAPEIDGKLELPPIPLQIPSLVSDREERTSDGGIFSAFTSYISSYAADDPPDPSPEELENTLCTVDCIKACRSDRILSNIFNLPTESLRLVVAALLSQLPEEPSPIVVVKPERPTSIQNRPDVPRSSHASAAYNPSTLFLLEFATILTLRDDETVAVVGESLTASLQTVIRDASNLHPLTSSRMVHYLLALLGLAFKHDFMRAPVVLHAISSFDDTTIDFTAPAIVNGLKRCIAGAESLRQEITNSPDFWSIMHRLHQHKDEAETVFKLLHFIAVVQLTAVTADNYESTIDLANDFASAASVGSLQEQRKDAARRGGRAPKQPKPQESPVVNRGVKALNIIYHLTSRISDLIRQSHLERNEAWAAYWSPIFRALSAQCLNPCREIRHKAFAILQRTLLSDQLASEDHTEWIAIFGEVLFPLVLRLLKPEVYKVDPGGMSETRIQAATLLCKIFLRYLDELAKCGQMLDVWLRILDILDRMMNSGQGDAPEEAVAESLKNILLVMGGAGYLSPPSSENQGDEDIWTETKKRLDRFLPDLFSEVFPETKDESKQEREAEQDGVAQETAGGSAGKQTDVE